MSSLSLGTQVGGRLGCVNSRSLELVEDCELIYLLGVFFCSINCMCSALGMMCKCHGPFVSGVALMIFESGMHFDFEKAKAQRMGFKF